MVRCEKCGSEDTYKISQVYSSSTHVVQTQTTTSGFGIASSGSLVAGVAGSSTGGTLQTLQAQMNAPPKRPSNAGIGCFLYFIFFLVFMFVLNPIILSFTKQDSPAHSFWSYLILIGGIVAVVMWASNQTKSQMAKYQIESESWNKKWICSRCGNTFIPN